MRLKSNYILSRLNNKGYKAYLVGGSVRDMLLEKEITDFDITTSAPLNVIEEIFSDLPIFRYGLAHGTLTVRYLKENFEITSFSGSSLKKDLCRRDFTINSIAMDIKGKLVYGNNSKNDLQDNLIRMNSEINIENDPLRILRGLRFSATYNFTIEQNTLDTFIRKISAIKLVSKERLISELKKIILGENLINSLEKYPNLYKSIGKILFGLQSTFDYETLLKRLSLVNADKLVQTSTIFLLSGLGVSNKTNRKSEKNGVIKEISTILNNFSVSNLFKKKVLYLIELLYQTNYSMKNLRLLLGKYGKYNLLMSLETKKILNEDFDQESVIRIIDDIISKGLITKESDLDISGYDFISLGIKGKEIKLWKKKIFNLVLENKITNSNQAITDFIKKNI